MIPASTAAEAARAPRLRSYPATEEHGLEAGPDVLGRPVTVAGLPPGAGEAGDEHDAGHGAYSSVRPN